MVSAVLHNACLRMEEQGVDIDDLVTPKGLHRWLGRSGIAFGGAASLLVGAVFGGILEGVPVLLPPPAMAASAPLSAPGSAISSVNPWSLAASVVPVTPAVPTAPVAVPDPGTLVPPSPGGGGGSGGGGGGPVPCTTCVTSTPLPTVPIGNGSGGATGSGGGTTGTTPPAGTGGGGGGLIQSVQQVLSNPTSVASDPTGTVTAVVQGATSQLGSTGLTGTSTPSSTSPLGGVTSTVTGTVGTVTGVTGSLGL